MSINPNAPVVSNGEIEIAAPVEKVWNIMSSVEQWPHWHPKVRWAELRGQLYPGTRMFCKYGSMTIASVVQEVEYQRYLSWKSKMLGMSCNHVWILDAVDGGTHVRTEESLEGPLAWLLRGSAKKQLTRKIADWLKYMKAVAERR